MRHDRVDSFDAREEFQEEPAASYDTLHASVRSATADLNGIVRLLTCGSVDDGKSTLIGRLLWDASPLYDDQRERLLKETAKLDGGQKRPDFSRLVDGLMAEQEQGITIDIAWHYFDTAVRRFVIIDAPGHEQYTRNMATGASHADVGVLLVDAQAGIKRQTRRHLAILNLVGVRRVVLAINKMDLANWSQARFSEIVSEFKELSTRFPNLVWTAIPVSALNGDNVVTRSDAMSWYKGPTFSEYLEAAPSRQANSDGALRMPVQMVLRDGQGFRGLAGTISSGVLRVGDAVRDAVSGRVGHVAQIKTYDGDLDVASCGQSVVVALKEDLDIARGSILDAPDTPTTLGKNLEARLVWLSGEHYSPHQSYLLRTATDVTPVATLEIQQRLNLDTLEWQAADHGEPNSILEAHIDLSRAVAFDLFADKPDTGAFLLVDALSGAAVAGGVITAVGMAKAAQTDDADEDAFILSRELLERGLCADLALDGKDEAEFRRRANEVAILLRAAGIKTQLA